MVRTLAFPLGEERDALAQRRASKERAACCDALLESDIMKGSVMAPPPRRLQTNNHEEEEGWMEAVVIFMYFMCFRIRAGPDNILEFSPDWILSLYMQD